MLKNVQMWDYLEFQFHGKVNWVFFDVDLPKNKIKNKEIVSDIIDEEYRYQWIGHH